MCCMSTAPRESAADSQDLTCPPLLVPTPTSVQVGAPLWTLDPAAVARLRDAYLESAPAWNSLIGVGVVLRRKPEVPVGGYVLRLNTGSQRIAIESSDESGTRSALATLAQLLTVYQNRLPTGTIEDQPSYAVRGLMLDVSRDRVPTMAHLREIIDTLAGLKFNHLQLYTEHTFAYVGHEEVWADASPITPDEARDLDAYARTRGIELAPNQNCFGHLASWLKRPKYQHLAEIEGDGVWKFLHWERRGPFSLAPLEPEADAFVGDVLNQLVPCFACRLVNIGCDETFDVGFGRSRIEADRRAVERAGMAASDEDRSRAESAARAEIYFEFVQKIAAHCERLGRQPMMWADIALTHPELLHLMPRGMIGLAWWYEPTEKFENWVQAIRGAGHEAWVCPGTSSWRSFIGRTTERRGNLCDAAEQGLRAGATGYLVCDWGDLGHRQQWPVALAALAHAAEASWNTPKARSFDSRAAALHVLGDATMQAGPWLDALGDVDLPIRQSVGLTNATALFNDLHPPVPALLKPGERCINATVDQWMRVRDRLDALTPVKLGTLKSPVLARELAFTWELASFAVDHAAAMRKSDVQAQIPTLIRRLDAVIAQHEALWHERSRPGGLASSTAHYLKVREGLMAILTS